MWWKERIPKLSADVYTHTVDSFLPQESHTDVFSSNCMFTPPGGSLVSNILNNFMTFSPCSSDVFDCRWKIWNLKREMITNISVQDLKKVPEGIRTSVGMAFFSLEGREGSMDGHPGDGISMLFLLALWQQQLLTTGSLCSENMLPVLRKRWLTCTFWK